MELPYKNSTNLKETSFDSKFLKCNRDKGSESQTAINQDFKDHSNVQINLGESNSENDYRETTFDLTDPIIPIKPLSPDILTFENKHKFSSNVNLPGELHLQSTMISSITSSLAETPGDSGVLCLDSETSELTSEYLPGMSLSLVEAEELTCDGVIEETKVLHSDEKPKVPTSLRGLKDIDVMTQSDIENQNITPPVQNTNIVDTLGNFDFCNLPDVVAISEEKSESKQHLLQKTHSFDIADDNTIEISGAKPKMSEAMKSASDDIVYRRKCNKKSNQNQPKKRVSFHEDILNNTKTDNIHIERGFITMYKPEGTTSQLSNSFKKQNACFTRNSWCTVGDNNYYENQMYALGRNTRSDVLTYGRTEVYGALDKSGIYEYEDDGYLKVNKCDSDSCVNKSHNKCSKEEIKSSGGSPSDNRQLYICSCNSSDSNLSTESETSSSQTLSCNSDSNVKYNSDARKCDNTQKSYSCDCIENGLQRPMIRTMYFSDADITQHPGFNENEEQLQMSEILPRTSCLKKSSLKKKRYISTDIIEEHESKSRKGMRSLLDTKAIFGSLKNIYKTMNFGLAIAERGVPEGSEDCQSVMEVLPPEDIPEVQSLYISKSFDNHNEAVSSFNAPKEIRVRGDGYSRNITHKRDYDIMSNKNIDIESPKGYSENKLDPYIRPDISKQNLTLDMKANCTKTFVDWKTQKGINLSDLNQPEMLDNARNKYIVNGESLVYEHKGVSYCYENDTFQTTFETTKDTFTPINDSFPNIMAANSNNQKKDELVKKLSPKLELSTVQELKDDEDVDDSKTISENLLSANAEKAKMKTNKLIDTTEKKAGVAKHLSSPLKQKNVMRYDKGIKNNCEATKSTNDTNFETNSLQDTINESDIEETLEILDGFEYNIKSVNRKSSLMNRFLKNVGQKKALEAKLQQNEFFQRKLKEESLKFPDICYPKNAKVCPNFRKTAKYIDYLINKEVSENKRVSLKLMTADEPSYFDSFEENVAIECNEKLKLELFTDESEVLHRMLKVRSAYSQETGKWTPLLVFITDRTLYVADLNSTNLSYNVICFLPHDQLDTIVIGPDSQYVKIFDIYGFCRCILITGDRYLCHRLVSSLEWSSRNCRLVNGAMVTKGNIPSIIWKYREALKNSLSTMTSVSKYELCAYYGMVGSSAPSSPGYTGRPASPFPPLEGFLMFKTEKQKYWRPSYFLLKSGVLSYGSSTPPSEPYSASSLPHSILLEGVLGVRRCTDNQGRPHCFEIALKSNKSLQMAAPDDDTASQWLQGLLMHAAQALEGPKIDKSKKMLPPCCTVLATSDHIITLREQLIPDRSQCDGNSTITNVEDNVDDNTTANNRKQMEILSCALIKDLTAFKIPDNDDNWCILEFHFCEVREGTEMGLLFGSSAELEMFIGTVESLWHTTNKGVFPISVLLESEAVSGRCREWHNCLVTAWDKMLPTAAR